MRTPPWSRSFSRSYFKATTSSRLSSLDAKFALLDDLIKAGATLGENRAKVGVAHKDFGELVGGLCLGAGQGEWGHLEVGGSDGALVCHLRFQVGK